MSHDLELSVHRDRGIAVLVLAGDLDLASAPYLRTYGLDLIDAALHPPPEADTLDHPNSAVLVVDVAGLDFLDSAGLGALIDVFKCVRSHRAGLSIAGANPLVHDLLARTGLTQVLALHASAAEAVDGASGSVRPGPAATDRPGRVTPRDQGSQ